MYAPFVGKQQPIRCATCGRLYNPTLPGCPFCARAEQTYRAGPGPASTSSAHEEFRAARRAVEEAEERGTRAVWIALLSGGGCVLMAITLSARTFTFEHGHVVPIGAIAIVGGALLATFAQRLFAHRLPGEALGRWLGVFLFGTFSFIALVYIVTMILNSAMAGPPVSVVCEVSRFTYAKRGGARASAHLACTLPDGRTVGAIEAAAKFDFKERQPFAMAVRRGGLGIWTFDPESARSLHPVWPPPVIPKYPSQ
ncbi:MAG: hypothetical protein HYV09_14825 [Deltaproteobacteria bacterium]|nr:hypothetical protein [Deltaproteobacteria bacterium]